MRKIMTTSALTASLVLMTGTAWAQETTQASGGVNAAAGNSSATSYADSHNSATTTNTADSNNHAMSIADSGNDSSDNSTNITDSGNDSSDNSTNIADSGNDSSDHSLNIADSGNDSSDHSAHDSWNDNRDNSTNVADSGNSYSSNDMTYAGTSNMFGDGAMVASATLSSYVSGVSVTYAAARGATTADNRLINRGNAFQNFAGIQALNQNTGTGASQNASVSLAVSTGDIAF